ncbi:DNA helicase [Alicyclobacillus hesperidum]|uniref:DNA helicase n=1 Tax=Alicyclobacillus hesperidum TaxID=89784 RepID=A0A1H2TSF4_9BACL|nr:RNA polymerase recycling motor HelD [Alicyclobacillus hesperidum]GLV13977.1 DNA helicase [Alicyclobacillus hesperidum]SDW46668.1 DNA helicase-2 / ATP-dependent DNA helicase PcrA [Alicyclobacillus hesperidum]
MQENEESRHPEWASEQAYVNQVVQRIEAKLVQMQADVSQVRGEVVDIRRHFWDDVTINVSNPDDLVETHFAIRQQAELLAERERRWHRAAEAAEVLEKQKSSPFFARIDFREQGEAETERVYIGIASFRDEETDEFLVYDWRAPIASLYYDHTPGPVAFAAPRGEIRGEMTLKRQFVIRGGTIFAMFDAGITIGDELLMYALSGRADAKMKNIVATIQREQNRVIRDDTSPVLIVRGAAGSGKTSAALQRAAYLLYKHRGRLEASQMLLFSPNPLFSSYVANVLPELGEQNIEQTTFYDYLKRRLDGEFVVEDGFDQLERLLNLEDGPEAEIQMLSASWKASPAFADAIHQYVSQLSVSGMRFLPIRFMDRTVVSADEVAAIFAQTEAHWRMPLRIETVQKELLARLDAFAEVEATADWVEDELELMSDEDYQQAHKQVEKRRRHAKHSFDDYQAERDELAKILLNRRLKPVRRFIQRLAFVDVPAIYQQWFEQALAGQLSVPSEVAPDLWRSMCMYTTQAIANRRLPYEDGTPYLYVKELLLGQAVNTAMRHVFIDEAQDYSALQLHVIRRLFPRSRLTLLGDPNQAIYAHVPGMAMADELRQSFPDLTTIELTQSYRSTAPIVRFTRGMARDGEAIVPFDREGPLPLVQQVAPDDQVQLIRTWIEEYRCKGYQSIAVICRTQREASQMAEQLKLVGCDVRQIDKTTSTFSAGVAVVPAYLAKGVEFDGVIVADGSASAYRRAFEQELFYTACTRAMHELRIACVGKPNRWIAEQPADTYTQA